MDRRRFLAGSASTFGALSMGVSSHAEQPADADHAEQQSGVRAQRPNVLILMSDQHKRSCMGVAGDSVAMTPNLDALARESVRFTNAYCSNPVCGPSRASIMTGLYTFHLETRGNARPFAPKHKTVAHHFHNAGYSPL
jgi:choline-sulfatase